MSHEEFLDQFNSLPPEAQRQVLDLIALLQTRYDCAQSRQSEESSDIAGELFIGMWRDRDDMEDSTAWVRSSREREWIKQGG